MSNRHFVAEDEDKHQRRHLPHDTQEVDHRKIPVLGLGLVAYDTDPGLFSCQFLELSQQNKEEINGF